VRRGQPELVDAAFWYEVLMQFASFFHIYSAHHSAAEAIWISAAWLSKVFVIVGLILYPAFVGG
jgi:hypothetical protein